MREDHTLTAGIGLEGKTPRWSAPDASSLSFGQWGDELVVYEHRSGNTHLITGLAGRLLLRLQEIEIGEAEIAPELQIARLGTEAETVGLALRELERIGLARRLPTDLS